MQRFPVIEYYKKVAQREEVVMYAEYTDLRRSLGYSNT